MAGGKRKNPRKLVTLTPFLADQIEKLRATMPTECASCGARKHQSTSAVIATLVEDGLRFREAAAERTKESK